MKSQIGKYMYEQMQLDAELKKAYQQQKTRTQQSEFKIRFAAARYDKIVTERSKTETVYDLNSVDGEYCTFARIVAREGGDPPAFETAKIYVRNAIAQWQQGGDFHGHPWIKEDKMRGSSVILHYREKVSSGMKKEWSMRTAEASEHRNDAAPASGHRSDATQPNEDYSKKRRREDVDDDDSTKKRLATALKKAQQLKVDMGKAQQAGIDLLEAVSSQTEWAWANNPASLDSIQSMLKEIELFKRSTNFWQAWTVETNLPLHVKKHYQPEEVIMMITTATEGEGCLKLLIERLNKDTLTLKRMQATRCA